MIFITSVFFILTVVLCFSLGSVAGLLHGLAGFLGTMCVWGSGAGLKGSLLVGNKQQKLGGLIFAIGVTTIGFFILDYSKLLPKIFSLQFGIFGWMLVSFLIGFFAADTRHAEN